MDNAVQLEYPILRFFLLKDRTMNWYSFSPNWFSKLLMNWTKVVDLIQFENPSYDNYSSVNQDTHGPGKLTLQWEAPFTYVFVQETQLCEWWKYRSIYTQIMSHMHNEQVRYTKYKLQWAIYNWMLDLINKCSSNHAGWLE